MKPLVRTGSAREYDVELEQVRSQLRPALRALEAAAAAPDALDEATVDLPPLQYALHLAGERVVGLEPRPGCEAAHEELTVALAIAREETADVIGALERDDPAAPALVWEWRAALFGVRLALEQADTPFEPAPPPVSKLNALVPVVVLLAGVLSVLGGALGGLWPVWVFGLGLVATATILSSRP